MRHTRSCELSPTPRLGMISLVPDEPVDEFAFLQETAEEAGIAWAGSPRVERQAVAWAAAW